MKLETKQQIISILKKQFNNTTIASISVWASCLFGAYYLCHEGNGRLGMSFFYWYLVLSILFVTAYIVPKRLRLNRAIKKIHEAETMTPQIEKEIIDNLIEE